jgi:rubrerythrin
MGAVAPLPKLSLECSSCGYGVAGSTPPERCPMCQREVAWVHKPWRPFSRER